MVEGQQPRAFSETICIYDESVPGSVINSVPKTVATKIRALYQGELVKGLTQLDEPRLKKALALRGFRPTPADNCLRANFWFEYNYQKMHGPPYVLDITRICGNVCSREFFYKFFLENPLAISWMLCPPLSYHQAVHEALTYGVSEMREILALEVDSVKGGELHRTNLKIGALRIIGELAGQITPNGLREKIKKKDDHVKAVVKALTEADLEARRILIERKMRVEAMKQGGGTSAVEAMSDDTSES